MTGFPIREAEHRETRRMRVLVKTEAETARILSGLDPPADGGSKEGGFP